MRARALSLLLLLVVVVTFSPCTSTDTMGRSTPISGNQTLVSPGGVFKLGFFSPPGATDGRLYLGIWYGRIPVAARTVVWVANRQSPLVGSPGVLALSADGRRLVILDGRNATVWSSAAPPTTGDTTTTSDGSASANATAQLQDSGNLVLKSSDGSVAWQSFDYPTDTLLPGMKLGVDNRACITRNITSWRSPADPSPGRYTFRLVPGGMPQFFLFDGDTRIYTSGPWNGVVLTGVPDLRSREFSFEVVSDNDETYYSYSPRSASLLSWLQVVDGATGQLRRYTWSHGGRKDFWFYPSDPCESYAKCGPFGYCESGGRSSPRCSCLPGFAPRVPGNASAGCARRTKLSCDGDGDGDGDGFWVVNRMKLPDATSATVYAGMSLERCRQACLSNCSCRAYAAANLSGGVSHGCVIWSVDLLDMRQFTTEVQDVYIRLAQSEIDALNDAAANHHRPSKAVIAIISTISGVLLLLAVLWCCFWRIKARRKHQSEMVPPAGKQPAVIPARNQRQAEILVATDNFAVENKIGEGGFGPVYKGKLACGQEIAVKRLSRRSVQGVEEFANEVKLIAKLQHRNLVRLLGCCINEEERILVYEYMDNQSLDTFIFDQGKRRCLGWRKRFEIILGIARGLLYLHEDSRFRIIHRDMKASNVLLDGNMIPKISDFGIARMVGNDQTTACCTLKVIGTYGYMSPEYAMDGLFSMKSDVYSFGVIVLEIVTGKRNRGFYEPELDLYLLGYAWMLWKEGRSTELVDELMDGGFDHREVLRCIQVALLCVEVLPRNRPLMSSVVMMLASDSATIPEPNEPGVNIGKNTSDTESSHGLTATTGTITEVDVR
ncbi:hypothetical protein ACP70R_025090 [Stipagrostis hirtigluma subsp. patula]